MIATRGLHHVAVRVRDLAAAERFYCGVLGLAVLRRWPAADGAAERSIWVDTGDGAFLALETADEHGDGSQTGDEAGDEAGWFLVALRIGVGERSDWKERLLRAGVAVYQQTRFTIYVRDPEGNRVGLSHWPDDAGQG